MTQPRPALRRAPDAEVHPALVILPDAGSATVVLPEQQPVQGDPAAEKKSKTKSDKRKKSKANKAKSDKGKSDKRKKSKANKAKKPDGLSKSADITTGSTPAEPANGTVGKFRGAGRATSDVLIGAPVKRATLKARIPAEIHAELRSAAAASGADMDDLLTEILVAWLAAPERW